MHKYMNIPLHLLRVIDNNEDGLFCNEKEEKDDGQNDADYLMRSPGTWN